MPATDKPELQPTRDSQRESPADRRTFALSATQWKTFMAALDGPPRLLPRLERLLKEPGFFDV
jgi:uncharacterized protein (DUF1778 family)